MQSLSAEFLAAAMAATPARLTEALAVLKGETRLSPVAQSLKVHEPFVTLETLSKLTGVGRITLWRYNVPGHKHAGRMRYRVSEVLAYLDSPEFQQTVKALRANGWKRPTAEEIAQADAHRPTGTDSASAGGIHV
jgi:hypothetical protein